MKKYLALVVIALALTLMFVSCNGDKQTTTEPVHTHTPGAWVTIKEPSCQLGEQSQFCATCGEVIQTLPIAATGLHKEVIDVAVPATCTSTGLTEGKHCLACGKIFVAQMETPKTAHTYDDSKDETCNTCDFVRDTSCKHTDVTVYEAKNANCIEAGITEGIVCNSCEEVLQTQQVIDALGHDEIIDKGYEATCTTAGLSDGKHCDRCGEVLAVQSYIKELGHKESDWVIEKEPTETEDGYKYKTCSICKQKTQEEVIPFIGDLGLDYTVNADGKTCTVTGIGNFDGAKLDIPDFIRQYKVTAIGDNAFSECIQLTEINLPETLVTIGTRAFYGCTGITEITIPESVTSIGTQIFYKAENLQTVYYNSTYGSSGNVFMNTPSIKKVVFGGAYVPGSILYNCLNIKTVEMTSDVGGIRYSSFYGCSSLTSITIPDSVTSIGDEAFIGCSSLKDVYYEGDLTSWLSIDFAINSNPLCNGANLYIGGNLVTNITIPNSITVIPPRAFVGCLSLETVTLGNSVKVIAPQAFRECTSLKSIEIPDSVITIGDRAFEECTSLQSIEIPNSVTSIGVYAFYNCTSLQSIEIPDSVITIGERTFCYCTSLASIELPDSITKIDDNAFAGCTSLKDVYYDGDLTSWLLIDFVSSGSNPLCCGANLYFDGNLVTDIIIPESITKISNNAFAGCYSLKSVKISDSVLIIGDGAFRWCEFLTNIELPDSITHIGCRAFDSCKSLSSIVIPKSVTSIDVYAFGGACTITIYCEAKSKPDGWHYEWANDITWNSSITVVWDYKDE